MTDRFEQSTGDDAPDPETTYAVDADCSRQEFLAASKLYARDVVVSHGLDVDVSNLDWEVSARAKRRAGAVRHTDGDPEAIVLAWKQFDERGWSATASTIRHELAHVHLLNKDGDGSHGPAFQQLAEALETHVHCERFTEPTWWIMCVDCGTRAARYRRSKLVRNPEHYTCGECGGDVRVEQNE